MKLKLICLTFSLFLISCQEKTKPFFAEEESIKRELEREFICDEMARANQPYANSGEASGIGEKQAYSICTPQQFLNIGKIKTDWDKYFIIREDLNFDEEILREGKEFYPIGEIKKYKYNDQSQNNALAFKGTIDGRGHRISGLTAYFEESMLKSVALFPYISKPGELRNLNFDNIKIIHSKNAEIGNFDNDEFVFTSVIMGYSDGGRFENINVDRIQLVSDFYTVPITHHFGGFFSGLSVNSSVKRINFTTLRKVPEGKWRGGFSGGILGGRYADIKFSFGGGTFGDSAMAGGFTSIIEGKKSFFLDGIFDAPLSIPSFSNIEIDILGDVSGGRFSSFSSFSLFSVFKDIKVKTIKFSNQKALSGGIIGNLYSSEFYNGEILIQGSYGSITEDDTYQGGGFGTIEYSKVKDVVVDFGNNNLTSNSSYKGGFAGAVSKSEIENITVKNISELNGQTYLGGLAGLVSHSKIKNSTVSIGKVNAAEKDSYVQLVTPEGDCVEGAFVGGGFGSVDKDSVIENVQVTATEVSVEKGKGPYVGGLIGFNRGNIYSSSSKTNLIKGAHFVGGLIGMNLSDEGNSHGKVHYSSASNGSYISGWSFVGGLIGSSGRVLGAETDLPKITCEGVEGKSGKGIELEIGESDFGGEVLYSSATVNNMFSYNYMGGLIGDLYKGNVNSSYVHLGGSLFKWSILERLATAEEQDLFSPSFEVSSTPEKQSNYGGVIGKANKSSIRNTYVHSTNFEKMNIVGKNSVGGFVGDSYDSEFFYNFSNVNLYGENEKTTSSGNCDGDGEKKTKKECEFECIDPLGNKEYSGELSASTCENTLTTESSYGWVYNIETSSFDYLFPETNETMYLEAYLETDAVNKCKDVMGGEVTGVSGYTSCISSFSCLRADGTIDKNLKTRASCESMGYCGKINMVYSAEDEGVSESNENGYVSERDCCLVSTDYFMKNRWVRNYFSDPSEPSKVYSNDYFYWARREGENWSLEVIAEEEAEAAKEAQEKDRVPKIGKFAGAVDITFDTTSNNFESTSVFVDNYAGGSCLNPNNPLVQNEYGEAIDEYSTDDSEFYECKADGASQETLTNQLSCLRVGKCNGIDPLVTRGQCKVPNSDAVWALNAWEPRTDFMTNVFGNTTAVSCVVLNQLNIKEKINLNLTAEEKQNLDTCNDSILWQLGRQDQIIFSTKVVKPKYFYYSYNAPMSYWNFDYFWQEVPESVPLLKK